ncbi:MAG TPA: hypothetical protein VHM90_13205 [Phycisphaerae bacterium]|jgi:hypothetical protein|nr:hypothetical protein [Phycisphaerae bacterium]
MPVLAALDVLGLLVLLPVLIIVAAFQVGGALGIMWLMHKYMRDQLTETTYGQFDFDNFQKLPFQDLLIRLAIMFGGATLLIHLLDYLFVGPWIKKYTFLVCFVLVVLESGAIFAGFHFLFRLDRVRLAVLTAGCVLFYLFWLWYLVAGRNYLA